VTTRAAIWPPRPVTSLQGALAALVHLVEDYERELSPESRGWLARLLVIRASGYLEQVVSECFRGHVNEKSGGLVRSFASSWLERSRNPSPSNMLDMVGRFDKTLQDELDELFSADDDRLKRELAFLVSTRNSIAHGMNEGVGPAKALALKDVAVEVADWFILRFNPQRSTWAT
jgi:hypothetical protein